MDYWRFHIFIGSMYVFTIGLLRLWSDLTVNDLFDFTALHYASSSGHTDVVEMLLNHNANINIVIKVTLIMGMSVGYSNL